MWKIYYCYGNNGGSGNDILDGKVALAIYIFLVLSGIIFAALLILVAIEAHQDNVLNDIAMREGNELEKNVKSDRNESNYDEEQLIQSIDILQRKKYAGMNS